MHQHYYVTCPRSESHYVCRICGKRCPAVLVNTRTPFLFHGSDTHEGRADCVCTDGRQAERDVSDLCNS